MSRASSERVRVRRGANRAQYDRSVINDILDANLVCHVGFVVDGEARLIPTMFVRIGDALYVHGNRRNLMLNSILDGQTVCVSIMQIDGYVLARSGFHHSMNYRSVVVYGKAGAVDDPLPILDAFVDRMTPGRSATLRAGTEKEIAATLVIRISIEEASAKVRTGPPVDDEEDYALDIWAGVLPTRTTLGRPEPDPRLRPGVALPRHLLKYAAT